MTELYPLKFEPLLKTRIWGGSSLGTDFGKSIPQGVRVGESWEISGLEGDESVVTNGFLAGNNINELIEVYMGDLTGEAVYERFGDEFPLLIKLIDTSDRLSVQVHPDDEMAARLHHAFGKTEMWYVMKADPGSEIYCGFRKNIGDTELMEALKQQDPANILNAEPAAAGDVFLIPAGLVHSVGPGIVLAEIQQASDVTYRIFDWNRKGEDGKQRELHTELALEALKSDIPGGKVNLPAPETGKTTNLVTTPWFNVNLLTFDSIIERDYNTIDSFVIFVCTSGEFIINWEKGTESVAKGETILIPATMGQIVLEPRPSSTLLEIYVNAGNTGNTN